MSVPEPERYLEALKGCFVVSFGLFSDETAEALADIVLPDASYLERLDPPTCGSLPGRGDWACQVRQPAVRPLRAAPLVGGAAGDRRASGHRR
jgi:anaerobic selenocysteine-containing dehydrogenase